MRAKSRKQIKTTRHGVTFIETIAVVLVTSILASVAIPTYISAFASYSAEMAAKKVVADLQYARYEAQRNSQSRTVQFDSANNQYTLLGIADRNRPSIEYFTNLKAPPINAEIVSTTFDGDQSVVFDMFGRPDSTGTVAVQSGNTIRTVILASDGSASIE